MKNATLVVHAQPHSVLSKVHGLLPEIWERADEIEANCRVPFDLLEKMERTGAFRMAVPSSYGGEELTVRESCKVLEAIAGADASSAWHVMVALGSQIITSRLPIASLNQYYASGPDTWPKAALAPKGVAVPVEGGYLLSGRWPLASGAREFDWVSVGFFVKTGNEILKGPDGKRSDFRFCVVPKDSFKVIETWDATGLRGTRSDDLEGSDIFVPKEWQASLFGPSNFRLPAYAARMPVATGPYHVAVVVGVVDAALADLAQAALTRRPAFNPASLMKDDPVFRSRFGELAIRFEALRALYNRGVDILEQCGREARDVTDMEAARLSAGVAVVIQDATRIMDDVMSLGGAGTVYVSNRQQRRWRDVRCAAQHQAANIGLYGDYASALVREAEAHPT